MQHEKDTMFSVGNNLFLISGFKLNVLLVVLIYLTCMFILTFGFDVISQRFLTFSRLSSTVNWVNRNIKPC